MLYKFRTRLVKQFRRKPFKGSLAYEWQVGPFVIMIYYFPNEWVTKEQAFRRFSWDLLVIPRLNLRVWHDRHWWGIPKDAM